MALRDPGSPQGRVARRASEGPGLISCDFAMCPLAGASGYCPRIVQGYLALQPSEGPGLISCDFAMCSLAGASGYRPRIVQGYLALQPSEGPGLISCDFAMCSLASASGYCPRIVQGYLAETTGPRKSKQRQFAHAERRPIGYASSSWINWPPVWLTCLNRPS